MNIDSGMSVYDGCRAERQNAPKLDPIIEQRGFDELTKWLKSKTIGQYYMLLCNELRYYTVFNLLTDSIENMVKEIKNCAESRGEILEISLDKSTNAAYEIWIRDYEDNEPHVFMFFNYDLGVIEVED